LNLLCHLVVSFWRRVFNGFTVLNLDVF
jgi:hypothetical protein